MSGRHKFSELTKDFTDEDRKRIDAIKAEMMAGTDHPEPGTAPTAEPGQVPAKRAETAEAD